MPGQHSHQGNLCGFRCERAGAAAHLLRKFAGQKHRPGLRQARPQKLSRSTLLGIMTRLVVECNRIVRLLGQPGDPLPASLAPA